MYFCTVYTQLIVALLQYPRRHAHMFSSLCNCFHVFWCSESSCLASETSRDSLGITLEWNWECACVYWNNEEGQLLRTAEFGGIMNKFESSYWYSGEWGGANIPVAPTLCIWKAGYAIIKLIWSTCTDIKCHVDVLCQLNSPLKTAPGKTGQVHSFYWSFSWSSRNSMKYSSHSTDPPASGAMLRNSLSIAAGLSPFNNSISGWTVRRKRINVHVCTLKVIFVPALI